MRRAHAGSLPLSRNSLCRKTVKTVDGLLAGDLPENLGHGVRGDRFPFMWRSVFVDYLPLAHLFGVKRNAEPSQSPFGAIVFDLGLLRKIADLDHALKRLVVEQRPHRRRIAFPGNRRRIGIGLGGFVLPDALPSRPGRAADQQQENCKLLHSPPFGPKVTVHARGRAGKRLQKSERSWTCWWKDCERTRR